MTVIISERLGKLPPRKKHIKQLTEKYHHYRKKALEYYLLAEGVREQLWDDYRVHVNPKATFTRL